MQNATVQQMSELLIQYEKKPGQVEQAARMLKKLQNMPVEERELLLQKMKMSKRKNS